MQRLEVRGVVRPIYRSLGFKGLMSVPAWCSKDVFKNFLNFFLRPACLNLLHALPNYINSLLVYEDNLC